MKICPKCHTANKDYDHECVRCFATLKEPDVAVDYEKICPVCRGTTYSSRMEQCPRCRSVLEVYSPMTVTDPNDIGWVPKVLAALIILAAAGILIFTGNIPGTAVTGAIGLLFLRLSNPKKRKAVYTTKEEAYQWTCLKCGIMNEGSGGECGFCRTSRGQE